MGFKADFCVECNIITHYVDGVCQNCLKKKAKAVGRWQSEQDSIEEYWENYNYDGLDGDKEVDP